MVDVLEDTRVREAAVARLERQVGALVGVFLAAGYVALAVYLELPQTLGIQRLWLAPVAFLVTVLAGWLFSLVRPAPDARRLRGLTLRTKTAAAGAGPGVAARRAFSSSPCGYCLRFSPGGATVEPRWVR